MKKIKSTRFYLQLLMKNVITERIISQFIHQANLALYNFTTYVKHAVINKERMND